MDTTPAGKVSGRRAIGSILLFVADSFLMAALKGSLDPAICNMAVTVYLNCTQDAHRVSWGFLCEIPEFYVSQLR